MQSIYAWMGVPDAFSGIVSTTLFVVAIAPWLGGVEIGPLKIPKLPESWGSIPKFVSPISLFVSLVLYAPLLPYPTLPPKYDEYTKDFFADQSSQFLLGAKPFRLSEGEAEEIKKLLGSQVLSGGKVWGEIRFARDGRTASFGHRGKPNGTIVIQGHVRDPQNRPAFSSIGEWRDSTGKSGKLMFSYTTTTPYKPTPELKWGDKFDMCTATQEWNFLLPYDSNISAALTQQTSLN
ncbi:hypothetical protein [Achromobacter sp. JUb104]|uniref:hypothetical protein n=1 Tax=Achromobacter sp. JUb104 TaxID=2940590 RepID=UPI00216958FB|nr:hypothetical protein [Achromobacter sp. JUb104]MCS3504981.1 hypothetical protein [Achromobacter sp. JUb104]